MEWKVKNALSRDVEREHLNKILKEEPAMHEKQFIPGGFEWVDLNHRDECVIVYKRKAEKPEDDLLVILNMTPEVYHDWVIEVHDKEYTEELFNSDLKEYDGTGDVFNRDIRTECIDEESKKYKITINLPPLAGLILK